MRFSGENCMIFRNDEDCRVQERELIIFLGRGDNGLIRA